MAQDSELVFSAPVDKLEDLLLGLKAFAETGRKMPVQAGVWPEHEMTDSYMKLRRIMGIDNYGQSCES